MKKLILAIILITSTCVISNAQESKMWVGGGLGFSYLDTEPVFKSFNIIPEFGYNINKHFAVGLEVGYGIAHLSKSKSVHTIDLTPFFRYNAINADRFIFFVDGLFSFGKTINGNIDKNRDHLTVGLRPGLLFKASDRFDFFGKFGFIGYSKEEGGGDGVFSFEANTNTVLGVAFKF